MPQFGDYAIYMSKKQMRGVVESIVGANLDALIKHSIEYTTNNKVGKKAKIPPRTVGRIRNAEVSCSIDTLASIAKVFSVEPWALLVPDYDPANPPVRIMTQDERDLYARTRMALEALPELEQPAANKQRIRIRN